MEAPIRKIKNIPLPHEGGGETETVFRQTEKDEVLGEVIGCKYIKGYYKEKNHIPASRSFEGRANFFPILKLS